MCRMDPERAEAFAEDLLDKEKLKDITAADGTLPGGVCTAIDQQQEFLRLELLMLQNQQRASMTGNA